MHHSSGNDAGRCAAAQSGRGLSSSVIRYAAGDCLLGAFRQALKQAGAACLEIPDQGCIWLDPASAVYRAEVDSPASFFSMPASALRASDRRPPDGAARARPVDELLYQSAWFGPPGALLDECQPYDVIQLRHWPNFTRLPHTRHVMPLSSLLSRRPTSLSFAYRMLRIPEADALRFYSAVTAAGYVRVISSQPKAAPSDEDASSASAADRSGSFWSRLFDRISGL